ERVVEELQHEVLPVDVDPPPEVREARGEIVAVVRLRQVEAEEMEQADDHVELSGDAEIEEERREHVLSKGSGADDLGRSQREVVVDETIQDQVKDAASDPVDPDLVDGIRGRIEMAPPEWPAPRRPGAATRHEPASLRGDGRCRSR